MIGEIKTNLESICKLCSTYNVQKFEIFGSAVSENKFDKSESDLDFLVEFMPMEPGDHARSYFSLLEELEILFDKKIDLVESKAIKNPYFLEKVNKERECLYAA